MITFERFLLSQPTFPNEAPTDRYYFDTALALVKAWSEQTANKLAFSVSGAFVDRTVLILTGYYQDMIADAGLWHAFIDEHSRLYGKRLPFYECEDYQDYELNLPDVRFMLWYCFVCLSEEHRLLSPTDKDLSDLAEALYKVLEERYDDAPIPMDYRIAQGLEMHCEEDNDAVLQLGNWLFLHSWLLTPAAASLMNDIVGQLLATPGFDIESRDGQNELSRRMGEAMLENPTGPLALYIREWVYLILEHRLPGKRGKKVEDKELHPYYQAFTAATGGKTLTFFATYSELNDFLINALGWTKEEEHLPVLKDAADFAVMVDPEKGMLIARNVAKCIRLADNPLYDKAYAREHAMELLTMQGRCPADLLLRLLKEDALPDAHFPDSDTKTVKENALPDAHFPDSDTKIVKENADFIARLYLQKYYRGD